MSTSCAAIVAISTTQALALPVMIALPASKTTVATATEIGQNPTILSTLKPAPSAVKSIFEITAGTAAR